MRSVEGTGAARAWLLADVEFGRGTLRRVEPRQPMAAKVWAAVGRCGAARAVPRTAPPLLHRVPCEQRQVPRAESAARCDSAVPYCSCSSRLCVRVSALCPNCHSDSLCICAECALPWLVFSKGGWF